MISRKVYEYCKDDITKIPNFNEAIRDKNNVWHCHHVLELDINGNPALSVNTLKRLNMYYNRPYFELVFLLPEEHCKLHNMNEFKTKKKQKRKKKKPEVIKTRKNNNYKEIYEQIKPQLIGLSADELYTKLSSLFDDEKMVQGLYRKYREEYKIQGQKSRKIRSDINTHRKSYKLRKETIFYLELIDLCEKTNAGIYIVPKAILTENFKQFLSRQKIKYISIK